MHIHGLPLTAVANAYEAGARLDQIARMGKGVLHDVFGRGEQQVVVEADLLAVGSFGQRTSVWGVLFDAPEGCCAWCLGYYSLRDMVHDWDAYKMNLNSLTCATRRLVHRGWPW